MAGRRTAVARRNSQLARDTNAGSMGLAPAGIVAGLPSRGVYVLVLAFHDSRKIDVGCLGPLLFRRGYHAYVGSAKLHLHSRVLRHMAKEKPIRWHIDWLTSRHDVNVCAVAATGRGDVECLLASLLRSEAEAYVSGFGSTDCRCPSHLAYFPNYSSIARVFERIPDLVAFRLSRVTATRT